MDKINAQLFFFLGKPAINRVISSIHYAQVSLHSTKGMFPESGYREIKQVLSWFSLSAILFPVVGLMQDMQQWHYGNSYLLKRAFRSISNQIQEETDLVLLKKCRKLSTENHLISTIFYLKPYQFGWSNVRHKSKLIAQILFNSITVLCSAVDHTIRKGSYFCRCH